MKMLFDNLQMIKIFLALLFSFTCLSISVAQTEKYPWQIGDVDQLSEVSWSPRNDLILTASGNDNSLRLWNASTGKLIWKTNVGFLQDDLELYAIDSSDWTADQKFIVTGTRNGKIQLWEAATGKLIWKIKAHAGTVAAIAISPDAKRFVSAAASDVEDFGSELKVWNLADGTLVKDLSAHQRSISAARFTDEHRFQTGDGFGRITTWSTNGEKPISVKRVSPCGVIDEQRRTIVYSPNFTLLAAQCQKQLVVINIDSGKSLKRLPEEEHYRLPVFSADERTLFIPGDQKIFDVDAGVTREFREFDGGALNSDGSLIATLPSYRADGVQIFDTRTGERRGWLVGHPGIIKSLDFSPDGTLFASGSADRIVRIFDTQSRKPLFLLEGHTRTVEAVEFSEDGQTLRSQSEKEVIVWNTRTGAKIKETPKEAHFESGGNRALSPSGKLALIEEYDKPFRLVDARTNETIKEFIFIDQLDNLVFAPDEERFLAKPWWGGWQLWEIMSGKPVREFDVGYSFHNRVAFHPNGRTFITGGGGQNIFMFDLESGKMDWSLFPIDHQDFEVLKVQEARRIASIKRDAEHARLADIENKPYRNRVHITFDHYGDMTPLGEQRIAESSERNKSLAKKPAAESNAVWLRLHNDSPLPVRIPTQSLYLTAKCFYEFPNGQKVFGLCDDGEISVWLSLEDKTGKPLRYGFDFGSSVILLPKKSALFSVPREILSDGNVISFGFIFQKAIDGKEVEDYGTSHTLRFTQAELPEK